MKKIVMAFALGILGVAGALGVGCSGDACTAYADDYNAKLEACGAPVPTVSASTTPPPCTDALAKLSECKDSCIPDVNCPCLKDSSGATCDADQKTYNECMTACGM